MKKYINIALIYAIAGLLSGLAYREIIKLTGFTGQTSLNLVHTHLFTLGMFLFMIVALFAQHHELEKIKSFRVFLLTYHIGLPLSAIMLAVRGMTQVLEMDLSKAVNASIAGLAGISHILVSVGIISLLLALKKVAEN
ncbi:DUF2871 domain-containing protein [Streptococcus suis]|nr:DUF2871 domain-containing protein [Streptococcus suis]